MIKRICNHCGRLYVDKCICRQEKRKYNRTSFYDTQAWRSLSKFIRIRDYNQDRLMLYFKKIGRPKESGIAQRLYDFVIDANGVERFTGSLLVHHIVPREDDYALQYETTNLITLNNNVHEYVHQLYTNSSNKAVVQDILHSAVEASLP